MTQPDKNTLYYGDNLTILRDYIADKSVDLIYLDPPFNSKRTYNVLFKDESGQDSSAQIAAFDDTWHWDMSAEKAYEQLIEDSPDDVARLIGSLREFIGPSQILAYLVMMAIRLIELHRVLKSTGSLYLHCDPTASHYLKIILDTIFGAENFRNEIVWQRTSSHNDSKKWGAVHDIILYYSKSKTCTWNPVFTEHDPEYIKSFYRHKDGHGTYRLDHIIRSASMGPRPNLAYEFQGYTPEWGWRVKREKLEVLAEEDRLQWSKAGRPYLKRYLHEQKGTPIKSVITDILPVQAQAAEKLGYPTQKPISLLERIVEASSNKNDLVLDPFCGCGTTVAAAEKLDRRWIGIDITHLAIALQKYRLQEHFPEAEFIVIGEPESVKSAEYLANQDRFQFEWWALSLVRARPGKATKGSKKGKKGADKGIDGVINFIDGANRKPQRVLVQVKSGKVSSRDIRDLVGTVEREKGAIGVLITLQSPSKPMRTEAASAGFYKSTLWAGDFPKIQILTIEELLAGASIAMPSALRGFKQAERIQKDTGQKGLGI